MKTYYFGVVARVCGNLAKCYFSIEANCIDAAERALAVRLDWLWANGLNEFTFMQLTEMEYQRRTVELQIDGVVIGRKSVPA